MNDFLPKDYNLPKAEGRYMKFDDGDNVFRILSPAITGWEYWNTENKPVRSKEFPKETPGIRKDKDGNEDRVKHFWAMAVWNYKTQSIQILEITQATVHEAINNLVMDEDWGIPQQYDLKVTRKGEGFETRYSVNPKPKSELAPEVKQKYEETDINLNALYTGGDPFAGGNDVTSDDDPTSDIAFT